MVFKSSFVWDHLNLQKHPNLKENKCQLLEQRKRKTFPVKMPGRASLCGQRRKITLWWGYHQTKAPPPALVLLTLQSPWTTQLTCTWVWAVNTESTEGFHSFGSTLSQSELWVWLRWAGWLEKPFLFEHLFKQGLWRVQQQWLLGMAVSGCGQLCSACCGSLLAPSPRAACRGLPASRPDSKPFLEMKLLFLEIPLLYPLFTFLSQPGVFRVDHKFLHPFFFFLVNVFVDDVVTWANICQEPSHLLSCFEAFECLALRNILQKFIFPGSKS